jgi:peptidoglycan hydrolase-like protein with peptidoglycan-binding domain
MRFAFPTLRRSLPALMVAGLVASGVVASPATAAAPKAPGRLTGYGFDACVAPSQSVMDTWNIASPFTAVGIYISGNSRYCGDEHQPNLSKKWVQANADNGWRFVPIHVGRQSPCFVNNPSSRVKKKLMSTDVKTARSQARSEAKETIAALTKYGFGKGSYSYLDIEWYKRTSKCDNIVLEFMDAWTEYLHGKGYKSGLYSSASAGIQLADEARIARRKGITLPDQVWFAWSNKKANNDGRPYLTNSGWKRQRMHQYHLDVAVTYGGKTLHIDKNYIDVGKGSKAARESKPCSVAMSFKKYPRLQYRSKGKEVAALECLLKRQGYLSKVDTTFGKATVRAIDAYRADQGWKPAGRTSGPTWTSLLAHGTNPRVLKEGSVGQATWRLQRALVAAGLKLTINGVYDASTAKAVASYRKARKLPSYPTVEAGMWKALNSGKTA